MLDLIPSHFGAVLGFGLGVLVVLRMLRARARPSVTLAWLLGMIAMPYLTAPAYLLVGERGLRRKVRRKPPLYRGAAPPGAQRGEAERVLVQMGMAPSSEGNALEFLSDGVTTYERLMATIDGARHTIDAQAFILARDAFGRELVQRLAERARQGVTVRLLLDAVGSVWTRGRFVDPLREAGGQVGTFMPMFPMQRRVSANLRCHRKLVVADGRSAWVSGMNFGGKYMGASADPRRWIDAGTIVEGPAVRDLHAVFAADWAFATGEEIELRPAPEARGDARVQVIASGPDVPGAPFADAVLVSVTEARAHIRLCTPYFVPDEPLMRMLTLRAQAGVAVTLLAPAHSDHPLTDLARGRFLRELRDVGAEVRLVPRRMLHAKVLAFDDELAVIGSANLDMRSLYLNFEVSLLVASRAFNAQVVGWFDDLAARARPLDDRPVGPLRRLAEDVGLLVSPLL